MPYTDTANLDYMPQFLTSNLPHSSSTMLQNRPWWMLAQANPFLGSPSAPSPLMQSPPGLSPLSVNCHSAVSPVILNPPSNETLRTNTPSKGALKAYPSPTPPQKIAERWLLPNNAVIIGAMESTAMPLAEDNPWKVSGFGL